MEKNVLLSVNGQESKLSFIDHPHGDQEVSKFQDTQNMWSTFLNWHSIELSLWSIILAMAMAYGSSHVPNLEVFLHQKILYICLK